MSRGTPRHSRTARFGLAIAVLSLGLLLATAATADPNPLQPITIGPISVGSGTVTLAAGSAVNPTTAVVTVNGQPASIDAGGTITASVDLTGQSFLTVAITDPATGQTTTTTVPLNLTGTGGVVPAGVLDALEQAHVVVDVPSGGFTSTNGQPVLVSGSVADKDTLASLTVNGVDALSLLQPDGTFTVPVPGTEKTVEVTATDKEGASQTSSYQITPLSPTGGSSSAKSASVSAASANGVTIVGVRYTAKGVKAQKRISMTLVVKDKRGLLIRGAKVRVRPASFQHNYVLGSQPARVTNTSGRVTFTLKLRAAKFKQPRRLFTVATATTPTAQASRTTSVRLPRLVKPKARH
jgi:hypothetical protein